MRKFSIDEFRNRTTRHPNYTYTYGDMAVNFTIKLDTGGRRNCEFQFPTEFVLGPERKPFDDAKFIMSGKRFGDRCVVSETGQHVAIGYNIRSIDVLNRTESHTGVIHYRRKGLISNEWTISTILGGWSGAIDFSSDSLYLFDVTGERFVRMTDGQIFTTESLDLQWSESVIDIHTLGTERLQFRVQRRLIRHTKQSTTYNEYHYYHIDARVVAGVVTPICRYEVTGYQGWGAQRWRRLKGLTTAADSRTLQRSIREQQHPISKWQTLFEKAGVCLEAVSDCQVSLTYNSGILLARDQWLPELKAFRNRLYVFYDGPNGPDYKVITGGGQSEDEIWYRVKLVKSGAAVSIKRQPPLKKRLDPENSIVYMDRSTPDFQVMVDVK